MERKLYDFDSRLETRHEQRRRTAQSIVSDFDEKLDISWIYHDNALEGVVLVASPREDAVAGRMVTLATRDRGHREVGRRQLAGWWELSGYGRARCGRQEGQDPVPQSSVNFTGF